MSPEVLLNIYPLIVPTTMYMLSFVGYPPFCLNNPPIWWGTTNLEIERLICDFWVGLRLDCIGDKYKIEGLICDFWLRLRIEMANLGLRLDWIGAKYRFVLPPHNDYNTGLPFALSHGGVMLGFLCPCNAGKYNHTVTAMLYALELVRVYMSYICI